MGKPIVLAIDESVENLAFLEDYFSDTRADFYSFSSTRSIDTDQIPLNPGFTFMGCGDAVRAYTQLKGTPNSQSGIAFSLPGGSADSKVSARAIPGPLAVDTFEEALFSAITFPETLKVLIVDDEPDICRGLSDFLEFRKDPQFEVATASNGLDGFKKIESFYPHVMVLDLKMPIKGGIDLYREVDKRYPDIRMIVLTASVGADEIASLRKIGAPVFVEKGGSGSSFSDLTRLIKKQWVFS